MTRTSLARNAGEPDILNLRRCWQARSSEREANMDERKFGSNNEYHLNQPLPKGVAAEILAKTQEFVEFLESTKTTTHPVVRAIHNSVTLQIAGLVGLVEAEKVREAGGGEDEMDAWERNGIVAKPFVHEERPAVSIGGDVEARAKELGLKVRNE
jgi:hypothetical protein